MVEVRPRRGEAAVALALLAVAVAVLVEAARMPRGTVALPGPGFFPGALAVLLAAAATGLLLRARRLGPADADRVRLGHRSVLVVLAGLAGVALLLERLGFVPTMALFLLVLFRALSPLGWWRSAVAAVVAAWAAWHFFHTLLGVSLPG